MDIEIRHRQLDSWFSSRMLSAIVGRLQVVVSALAAIYYVTTWSVFDPEVVSCTHDNDCAEADFNATKRVQGIYVRSSVQFGLLTLTSVIALMAGLVLILGVKQESASKVEVWMVLQLISLGVLIYEFILERLWKNPGYEFVSVQDIVGISFNVGSIMVVSFYLSELLRIRKSILRLMEESQKYNLSNSDNYGSTCVIWGSTHRSDWYPLRRCSSV